MPPSLVHIVWSSIKKVGGGQNLLLPTTNRYYYLLLEFKKNKRVYTLFINEYEAYLVIYRWEARVTLGTWLSAGAFVIICVCVHIILGPAYT